jgi:hypothetical protein
MVYRFVASNLLEKVNTCAVLVMILSNLWSDKRREKMLVARSMLQNRGTGRASHICGRFTIRGKVLVKILQYVLQSLTFEIE